MAHVSHKLSNSFEGALAGGGDPASSPLYVFGPFLKLIVVAGVARVTFGASIWLVVLTVVMVSAMYRRVMSWVTDGSGGSGLNEEEFGSWAVKVSAGITFVEYTLTFLVSMAALVTFIADRFPPLNSMVLGFQYRTIVAVVLSVLTGWLVNRGPKSTARAFGPATLAVLLLLWSMVIATVWKLGFHLPELDLRAFHPDYLHFTFGGYARILALMTGIEIFANLVAAYEGTAEQKSRKAFRSLAIIMGTTSISMLVVGPAILALADPGNERVSVFTQTMDRLLPAPLAYLGTLVGIVVLGSAAAASAQGLQNLALGLRYRHYIPALLGQRNRFDVAAWPVWIEVGLVSLCFLTFGTHEETYLAIYAIGVFILLSMTGWATAKRLTRELRGGFSVRGSAALGSAALAALLTSGATVLVVMERFREGAWTYFVFLPLLYAAFTYSRGRLGKPQPLQDHLGRFFVGQYLLPYQRQARSEDKTRFDHILVPLNSSSSAEQSLPAAQVLAQAYDSRLTLLAVNQDLAGDANLESYLGQVSWQLQRAGLRTEYSVQSGHAADVIHACARDNKADLIVMTTHGRSEVERWFVSDVPAEIVRRTSIPVLLIRPTEDWSCRRTRFQRLLVTLDGSEVAEEVLRYARSLAKRFASEVLLLAVPESETEGSQLQNYVESVAGALRGRGLRARALAGGSGPARTIVSVSESENADLILMATRGRGGLDRGIRIGSVADRVIQTTQCPVMLVPA